MLRVNSSVNFRNPNFNDEVQSKINKIHINCHKGIITQDDFTHLHDSLYLYYQTGCTISQASILATEIYSQFLQHLIYYLMHAVKNIANEKITQIALQLILNQFFFYVNESKVISWIDPKEQFTVLNSASKEGYTEVVGALIEKAKNVYGGKNTPGFIALLTHPDKDQFSALNTACKEGHFGIVKLLIAAAEDAFRGKKTPGFIAFLTHLDKDQFSALNTACKEGHDEIVKLLIAAADEAFDGKKTPGFIAFLTHLDKDGFSPLNSACKEGHDEIVKLLIAAADEAFDGKKTPGFIAFLTHLDKDQFSALNTACKEGHFDIVKLLIAAAEEAFDGKKTPGFIAFLTHLDKDGFSLLNSACKEGHFGIVQLLIAAAEEAFGDKKNPGFTNFLNQVNKDQYSALNSACIAGHFEIAKTLLETGENAFGRNTAPFKTFLEKKNTYGYTPLNAACSSLAREKNQQKINQLIEIIKLLIHYSADPTIKNNKLFPSERTIPAEYKSLLKKDPAYSQKIMREDNKLTSLAKHALFAKHEQYEQPHVHVSTYRGTGAYSNIQYDFFYTR